VQDSRSAGAGLGTSLQLSAKNIICCHKCKIVKYITKKKTFYLPNSLWMIMDSKVAQGQVENAIIFSCIMCEIECTESALGQSSTASWFKMIWLRWFKSVTFCWLEILYY